MTGKVVPMTGYDGYKHQILRAKNGRVPSRLASAGATRQAPTFAIQCPGGHGLGGCAS